MFHASTNDRVNPNLFSFTVSQFVFFPFFLDSLHHKARHYVGFHTKSDLYVILSLHLEFLFWCIHSSALYSKVYWLITGLFNASCFPKTGFKLKMNDLDKYSGCMMHGGIFVVTAFYLHFMATIFLLQAIPPWQCRLASKLSESPRVSSFHLLPLLLPLCLPFDPRLWFLSHGGLWYK